MVHLMTCGLTIGVSYQSGLRYKMCPHFKGGMLISQVLVNGKRSKQCLASLLLHVPCTAPRVCGEANWLSSAEGTVEQMQ